MVKSSSLAHLDPPRRNGCFSALVSIPLKSVAWLPFAIIDYLSVFSLDYWFRSTVWIWITDYTGIQMVESCPLAEWSAFQIKSWISYLKVRDLNRQSNTLSSITWLTTVLTSITDFLKVIQITNRIIDNLSKDSIFGMIQLFKSSL